MTTEQHAREVLTPAQIAAGLTFIEQCFLSEGRVRMAWPFEVKARDRLIKRGLVRRRWFGYRFTPLGLSVRQHLLEQDAEGRS